MALKKPGLFGAEFKHRAKDILSSRFMIPPFTVLNTREGFWQNRKRAWINIGIKSELGRGYTEEGTAYGSSLGKSGELNKRYKDGSPGGSPRPAMGHRYKNSPPGTPAPRSDGHGRPIIRPKADASPYSDGTLNNLDEYRDRGKSVKRGFPAMKGHGQGYGKDIPIVQNGGPHSNTARMLETGEPDPIGGTSIFDPTLCELIYRWFCQPGGRVLDPFAGGSVRGIIAGELGLHYTGIDLSRRQLNANIVQAKEIGTDPAPEWICGDSADVSALAQGKFNLLFSCPPYGDLERYSDDPRDLSTLDLAKFRQKYHAIIESCCYMMKDESFACFVVGDYRDKFGYYANLPGQTIAAFERAGLHLYNSAILVNSAGSLPLRIQNQFNGSRKMGTCHQHVLIFSKGDPKVFVKKWSSDFTEGV